MPRPDEHEAPYPLGLRRTFVAFAGVSLGMSLAALSQGLVNTALPSVIADLGGVGAYTWAFSAYMLALTVTLPLWGKASDIYGRRRPYLGAIVVFMLGTAICGLAPSMGVLVVGRVLQGVGSGGLAPLSAAVIGDMMPPRQRGRWQGAMAAIFGACAALGPAIGGWITDAAGWRWTFFGGLPLGVIAFLTVRAGFTVPARRRVHHLDLGGAALLATGLCSGLLALTLTGDGLAWPAAVPLGLVAVVLLTAFARVERAAAEPVVPLSLFREPTVRAAAVATFAIGSSLFGLQLLIPLFIQAVLGETAGQAGTAMTPTVAGSILAGIVAGTCTSRTGLVKPVLVASSGCLLAGALALTRLHAGSSIWAVVVPGFVIGTGVGLGAQSFVIAVQNVLPERLMGTGTSTVTFFRMTGGAVGVTVLGTVALAGTQGLTLGDDMTAGARARIADGVHAAAWILVGLAVAGTLASLRIRNAPLRTSLRDADDEAVAPRATDAMAPGRRSAD